MLRTSALALAALAAGAIATPTLAQPADEEIVVMGRYGTAPDSVRSLSQPVSYADLDLSTKVGRDILHQRLKLTARYLCDKLGETDTSSQPIPSCRDAAVSDAEKRVGSIEAHFAPRGTTWVAPPAWVAPYPTDWSQRYP